MGGRRCALFFTRRTIPDSWPSAQCGWHGGPAEAGLGRTQIGRLSIIGDHEIDVRTYPGGGVETCENALVVRTGSEEVPKSLSAPQTIRSPLVRHRMTRKK